MSNVKQLSSESKARALARAETAKAYLEKKYSKMKQVNSFSLPISLFHSFSFLSTLFLLDQNPIGKNRIK